MKDAYSNIYLKSVIRRILLFRLKSSVLLCTLKFAYYSTQWKHYFADNAEVHRKWSAEYERWIYLDTGPHLKWWHEDEEEVSFPNERCSIKYIANKSSERMGRAIESFFNRRAEPKLDISWWLL